MNVEEPIHWFIHPQQQSFRAYVIFDVCHMLKLMRNLLGHYKVIAHTERDQTLYIKWEYIDYLNSIQEDLGFNFANKLKKKHLCWEKHKMNVKLAAQTLSASVASAIKFLHDEALLMEFQGSEATCEFIKQIDLAFDLMNSRNSSIFHPGHHTVINWLNTYLILRQKEEPIFEGIEDKQLFRVLYSVWNLWKQLHKIFWIATIIHTNMSWHTNFLKITLNFCSTKSDDMGVGTIIQMHSNSSMLWDRLLSEIVLNLPKLVTVQTLMMHCLNQRECCSFHGNEVSKFLNR